jgi:uncharacterized protein (DUF58 family)
MYLHLPRHSKTGGFAPSGFINLEYLVLITLVIYVASALLQLALGKWISAVAMLLPLVVLLLVVFYLVRRARCRVGDHVRVSIGPHVGMEGTIVSADESCLRFRVQLSSAEHPDSVDFSCYHITKVKKPGALTAR